MSAAASATEAEGGVFKEGETNMRMTKILLVGAAATTMMAGTAFAEDPIGKGVTMYMQMGGTAGDGATLARQFFRL
jgi:hypothetical protein